MRADDNSNPTAFTTGIAEQAKLVPGVDYVEGTEFPAPSNLFTAKLLGDPVAVTIRVLDAIGYYTKGDLPRWNYIAIPRFVWLTLSAEQKRDVIGFHYHHEGGSAMIRLFPNYGKPGYF